MIKKLLVVLTVIYYGTAFAQDPDLIGDWQLLEMHIDGTNYVAPSDDDVELIAFEIFPSGPDNLVSSACNGLLAEATFTGTTAMTLTNVVATLGGCLYNENDDFEAIYFGFFENVNPNFTYNIADLGPNAKQLVITDSDNNTLVFTSELLRQYVFELWYLQKMIIDDVDIPVPFDGSPFYPEIEFGQTFDPATAGYTGDAGCSAYSGSNTFVTGERVVTLTSNDISVLVCNTQAQIDFEAIYLDFLFGTSPQTFDYLYLTPDDTIIFYLRDANNNYAIYGPNPPTLGVDENSISTVSIFPNPVADTFSLNTTIAIEKVTIYGISGNLIYSEENPPQSISISTLTAGVYFVEVTAGNQRSVQKLIKK